MKILHVFDFFSPHGGGTVDVIFKLGRVQAQRGQEVTLLTSDHLLDRDYLASLPRVKVLTPHCILAAGSFYVTPGAAGIVRRQLRRFDIVHLHCFRSFQNILIHHYARKYGIPYIVDSHGSLPRVVAGERMPKWILRWLYDVTFGYRLLRDASRVIAQNSFAAGEYRQFGVPEEKISLIPLFFPVEEFRELPQKGLFRRQYGLEDRKIVMFLGRINRIKGLDFLVEAFQTLARVEDKAFLVIVGPDDGYQKTLESLIDRLGLRGKVLLTGFLGGSDKLAALVDADVLVQPSRYEQAAWAPVEAILCGTPVIVTRGSGSGEDIERIGGGHLVDYGDEAQLTRSIRIILNEPEEAREKAAKGREYIRQNLDINRRIEDYDRLYRECLQAR